MRVLNVIVEDLEICGYPYRVLHIPNFKIPINVMKLKNISSNLRNGTQRKSYTMLLSSYMINIKMKDMYIGNGLGIVLHGFFDKYVSVLKISVWFLPNLMVAVSV